MTWKKRALVYLCFAALFWVPLFLLVRYGGFAENPALIASGLGVIPLLLLFVPLFEVLTERMSSVKVAGVELHFGEAIAKSMSPTESEMVYPAVDKGREVVYGKASSEEFLHLVRRHFPQRNKRLVLAVDLKDSHEIWITMLYFQARHLERLFDLRAFLFLDTRHADPEARVLGTVPGWRGHYLLGKRFRSLPAAFGQALKQSGDPSNVGLAEYLDRSWRLFTSSLQDSSESIAERRFSEEVFRSVYAEELDRCVLNHPMRPEEYPLLFQYLDKAHDHLILVSRGEVVNVRSVDRVAREMVRRIMAQSQAHEGGSQKTAK